MCGAPRVVVVPRGGNLRDRTHAGLIGPERGKTRRVEAIRVAPIGENRRGKKSDKKLFEKVQNNKFFPWQIEKTTYL
jgi:hypothetical protein